MDPRHRIAGNLHGEGGGLSALTPRHVEVIGLMCTEDLTYAEVGERLGIAESTVKNHAHEILRRLGKRTMRGACYELCMNRMLPIETMRPETV
jgi:DNA-binding NarL/FixJ family response regulator